jgi:phage host-nuclease inhibitor protein Gam
MKNQLENNNPTERDIEFGEFIPAFADTTDEPEASTLGKPDGQKASFIIENESGANWYLKKITLWDAEKAILKAQYEQRIAEIDADRKRLDSFYLSQVETWARGEQETRRRKTITLAYGTVSFRTVPAHVKVIDAEAALAEASKFGEEYIIPQPAKLDTKAWQDHVQSALEVHGVLPEGSGCDFIPARESVSIKIAKEKPTPSE